MVPGTFRGHCGCVVGGATRLRYELPPRCQGPGCQVCLYFWTRGLVLCLLKASRSRRLTTATKKPPTGKSYVLIIRITNPRRLYSELVGNKLHIMASGLRNVL